MIIGLNGRLKAGKDTTYTVMKELFPNAERISFAEPLKISAAASIGISVEDLERLKGREDLYFTLQETEAKYDPFHIANTFKFNVRQYLQWYGTEGHRDVFGTDFWVDQALPLDLDHSTRFIVITDMRFPNELERVRALGGVTVKVVREVATAHGSHASEQNLDDQIDYFLNNTGSMDDLRMNVLSLVLKVAATEGVLSANSG